VVVFLMIFWGRRLRTKASFYQRFPTQSISPSCFIQFRDRVWYKKIVTQTPYLSFEPSCWVYWYDKSCRLTLTSSQKDMAPAVAQHDTVDQSCICITITFISSYMQALSINSLIQLHNVIKNGKMHHKKTPTHTDSSLFTHPNIG